MFFSLTPSHPLPHGVVGLAYMTFLYNSGQLIMQFLANNFFSNLTLTPPNSMLSGVANQEFSIQCLTFDATPGKTF